MTTKTKQLYTLAPIALLVIVLLLLVIGQQKQLNYLGHLIDASNISNNLAVNTITLSAIEMTLNRPVTGFIINSPKPQSANALIPITCANLIRQYISQIRDNDWQGAYLTASLWLDSCSN